MLAGMVERRHAGSAGRGGRDAVPPQHLDGVLDLVVAEGDGHVGGACPFAVTGWPARMLSISAGAAAGSATTIANSSPHRSRISAAMLAARPPTPAWSSTWVGGRSSAAVISAPIAR